MTALDYRALRRYGCSVAQHQSTTLNVSSSAFEVSVAVLLGSLSSQGLHAKDLVVTRGQVLLTVPAEDAPSVEVAVARQGLTCSADPPAAECAVAFRTVERAKEAHAQLVEEILRLGVEPLHLAYFGNTISCHVRPQAEGLLRTALDRAASKTSS